MNQSVNRIAILENSIQEYAWGSKTFIPELIGELSPAKSPKAEMWMGSHPKAPSIAVCDGNCISLAELISRDPSGILGESIAKKFSHIPLNLPIVNLFFSSLDNFNGISK